jgi:glutamate dehydrogenase
VRFVQRLEAKGKLSRRVEGLPSTAEIAALRGAKQGLTRPELAKLVAYAKIDLFDALVASQVPDDPAFVEPLKRYFPSELAKFEAQMQGHRLRREIIATQLANELVNRCGPSFVDRVREISRAEPVVIASAFECARRIFDLEDLAARINQLDNKAPAAAQMALHQLIASALRRLTTYLAQHAGFDRTDAPSILDVVDRYKDAVVEQRNRIWDELSEVERARVEAKQAALVKLGAPADLAREAAMLAPLSTALDVADLARGVGWPVAPASLVHCMVGAEFGLDALRETAMSLQLEQHWDRLVVRRAAEDFAETQRRLAEAAARAAGAAPKSANAEWATSATRDWIAAIGQPAERARAAYAELNAQGQWTFAKLMLIAAEFNALVSAVR